MGVGNLERSAEHMLPVILANKDLVTFFDLPEDGIPRLRGCINFFSKQGLGLQLEAPPQADIKQYHDALEKLKACPITPPYFVTKDIDDPELFHFCLESRNEKPAVLNDGKYYLLYPAETLSPEVESRVELISISLKSSSYPGKARIIWE